MQSNTITPEEAAHQARVAANIAAVRAAEATDSNIGREWNSIHGRQRIRNRMAGGGTIDVTDPTYEVITIGTDQVRRYRANRIEQVIETDEHRLTPEYAKEQAVRAEQAALIEAARIQREQEEAKELAEIAKFTAAMSPMAAGKARNALLKLYSFSGVTLTLRQAVADLVAKGEPIEIRQEWAIKEMTRTQFNRADARQQDAHEKRRQQKGKIPFYYVGNYSLGKTAYLYAAPLMQSQQAAAL